MNVDRPLYWKILNLWFIPFFFFSVILSFFGIMYMGVLVNNKRWLKIFGINFILFILAGYLVLYSPYDNLGAVITGIYWLYSSIFMIHNADNFLRSLDRNQKESKAYKAAQAQIQKSTVYSKDDLAQGFISDMHKWHKEVESDQMKNLIEKIISLSTILLKKDSDESVRFFTRYRDTLNRLLKKYDEIENTRLESAELKGSMKKLEENLTTIVSAFEKEIAGMYKNDILNINAEISAFIQNLESRGLVDHP